MAKFQLQPDETMVGSGQMSLYLKQGLSRKPFQGNVYITDRRACFKIGMVPGLEMDLPLEEIQGFSVKKTLFITQVTIHSKGGEPYPLTGFPAKKLQDWLRQAGVREI